jgi:hypothetical protein
MVEACGMRIGLVGDDSAIDEFDDSIAANSKARIVRYDQERRAEPEVDRAQQVEHSVRGLCVEISAWLVCEYE